MSWFVRLSEVLIPVFVAVSPLTVVPLFVSMTDGMALPAQRAFARRGIFAAFIVAALVALIGQALFRFLGITVNDLRMAGGVILLSLSTYELVFSQEERRKTELSSDAGVVPLGVPLIVGPATLTTCMVRVDTHGRTMVIISLALCLGLTWLILHYAHWVQRVLTPGATRAFGKVMSLFLAAIAVGMLRSGLTAILNQN